MRTAFGRLAGATLQLGIRGTNAFAGPGMIVSVPDTGLASRCAAIAVSGISLSRHAGMPLRNPGIDFVAMTGVRPPKCKGRSLSDGGDGTDAPASPAVVTAKNKFTSPRKSSHAVTALQPRSTT